MKLLRMTLRTALRALRRNKLRSVLTMLGIIIGVAAVITMVSIGQGADAAVQQQIRIYGPSGVFPGVGARPRTGCSVNQVLCLDYRLNSGLPI